MRYVESLIIGFLIGCTALLLQVFTSVLFEIVFGITLPLHYSAQSNTVTIFFTIIVIACIEEILRFAFIYKKFNPRITQLTSRNLLGLGTLIGCGFALCEILLAVTNSQYTNSSFVLFIWPLLIHVTVSMFLTYASYSHHSHKIILTFAVLSAIIYHASANIMIFMLLN